MTCLINQICLQTLDGFFLLSRSLSVIIYMYNMNPCKKDTGKKDTSKKDTGKKVNGKKRHW